MHETEIKKGKVFPFVWPWKSAEGQSLGAIGTIKSRIFSVSYLLIIWSIVGVLGFASTWDCESTWQLELYCEYSFWLKNFTESPILFIRNLLTTLFFHNSIDHILFVSLFGMFTIIQSFEIHFGAKKTILMFLSAYLIVAPLFGLIGTIGIYLYPNSAFFQFSFARSWIGGSLGMFQIYGALAIKSREPIVMLIGPLLFEAFNQIILEIDPQIPVLHLMSTFTGYLLAYFVLRR